MFPEYRKGPQRKKRGRAPPRNGKLQTKNTNPSIFQTLGTLFFKNPNNWVFFFFHHFPQKNIPGALPPKGIFPKIYKPFKTIGKKQKPPTRFFQKNKTFGPQPKLGSFWERGIGVCGGFGGSGQNPAKRVFEPEKAFPRTGKGPNGENERPPPNQKKTKKTPPIFLFQKTPLGNLSKQPQLLVFFTFCPKKTGPLFFPPGICSQIFFFLQTYKNPHLETKKTKNPNLFWFRTQLSGPHQKKAGKVKETGGGGLAFGGSGGKHPAPSSEPGGKKGFSSVIFKYNLKTSFGKKTNHTPALVNPQAGKVGGFSKGRLHFVSQTE